MDLLLVVLCMVLAGWFAIERTAQLYASPRWVGRLRLFLQPAPAFAWGVVDDGRPTNLSNAPPSCTTPVAARRGLVCETLSFRADWVDRI